MKDIYALAGEAHESFEIAYRGDDPEQPFTCLKEEHRGGWLHEIVFEARGDFWPDDWRYEHIQSAFGWIHDNEPADLDEGASDFADTAVDVYNTERCAWLASSLRRGGYCDEAAHEFGFTLDADHGVFDLIGLGQYFEAEEIYAVVVEGLQERHKEITDDEEGEHADQG